MKAFVREATTENDQAFSTEDLEARLSHLEDLIHDLHDWMRSEQVAGLPEAYRQLYSSLIENDFEPTYAAELSRKVYHAAPSQQENSSLVRSSAADEIGKSVMSRSNILADIDKRSGTQRPFVLALVGPSGAGKTTLMYKLAVAAVLNFGLRVKIISSDTYKIGSVEGVQTIADILSVPFGIAFEADEIAGLIEDAGTDLVILDTAGRSDRASREELSGFLAAAKPDETLLVLAATMSRRALQETAALFLGERITATAFTKLDEAPALGGMISALAWMQLPLAYLSSGTVIPDDLLPAAETPVGPWALDGIPAREHNGEGSHV